MEINRSGSQPSGTGPAPSCANRGSREPIVPGGSRMTRFTATALSLLLGPAGRASASTEPQGMTVTRSGSQPSNKGSDQYFTGSVRVDPLFQPKAPSRVSGAYVSFEPGARSAWHTHPLGQTLIVTAGTGWVQQEGGAKQEVKPGDVIWTPPGVKHWHGAAATNAMTHIAVQESLDGRNVEWMEKVSDEKYTQERLLGDVWKRPGLSARDRSVVTFAALIARNQTIEMPYYLNLALDNGVKPREISEIITHLAFYSGWGNATATVAVAKDVFSQRKIGIDQLPAASPQPLPLDQAPDGQRGSRVGGQFGKVSPGIG